jgi:hypothetical protein
MEPMGSYWWECSNCGTQYDFQTICQSRGITHYIWDVLIPSGWDQDHLVKNCTKCDKNILRITYIFPRAEKTHLQVKHIVGLGPFDDVYVPMMWETIPDGNNDETWIDFKYINGRNIWGLNKPAVFSKEDMRNLFQLYRERTGDHNFP